MLQFYRDYKNTIRLGGYDKNSQVGYYTKDLRKMFKICIHIFSIMENPKQHLVPKKINSLI